MPDLNSSPGKRFLLCLMVALLVAGALCLAWQGREVDSEIASNGEIMKRFIAIPMLAGLAFFLYCQPVRPTESQLNLQ